MTITAKRNWKKLHSDFL